MKSFLAFHEGIPLWQFNPLEDSFCVPEHHPPVPEAAVDTREALAFLQVQHQREAHHAPRVPRGRRGAPTPSGTLTLSEKPGAPNLPVTAQIGEIHFAS